jgi:hypothetical protein
MKYFDLGDTRIDAIDLKCLISSKGVRMDDDIYDNFSDRYRISRNPRRNGCLILSNGYVTPLADMGPTLKQFGERYFLSPEEALDFDPQMDTPFRIQVIKDKPALTFLGDFVDFVTFPEFDNYYDQVTSSGLPFIENSLLQGNREWITFGYEWPCEYAIAGMPCQYCHCGNETAAQARNKKPYKEPISEADMCEIIKYAVDNKLGRYLQITGGSTFDGKSETAHFVRFLDGINDILGRDYLPGDIVFYLTPPKDWGMLDYYIAGGVDKLGMSVEVWDRDLAAIVTPGKVKFASRDRHLQALEYVVEKHGPGYAFCQFVVGCEPFESMAEGAVWLAERGITPVASILQQSSLKINDRVVAPDLDYYKRVKELFLDLYSRYDIIPAEAVGENGCVEIEFYNEVHGIAG